MIFPIFPQKNVVFPMFSFIWSPKRGICDGFPKTVMRDEGDSVDLIYDVAEGDRWKVGQIRVNIEGEPHLMRETTMLNLVDLREGDWIDRRTLELNRKRIERSQLLETNPQIADPPDIKVVPRDDYLSSL